MSHRGTRAVGLSLDSPRAPVPTVEDSFNADPPPYSACVPYFPTLNSNYPDSHSPHLENPSETFLAYGIHHSGTTADPIVHETTSSIPFLDDPRGSGNYDTTHIPRTTPYNPQPSSNPSYIADQQNNLRTNAYGWKAIVLERAEGENSACEISSTNIMIASCIGVLIGCIITVFAGTYVLMTIATVRNARKVNFTVRPDAASDLNYDKAYDNRIFVDSRDAVNSHLTAGHQDYSKDLSWKSKDTVTLGNPFLDYKSKNNVNKESMKKMTEEKNNIFPHLKTIEHDYSEKLKDIFKWKKYQNNISDDPIIKPFPFSDKIKDILGITRNKQNNN